MEGNEGIYPPYALIEPLRDVMGELMSAKAKFPEWPEDPLHAVAVNRIVDGKYGPGACFLGTTHLE